MQRDLKLSEVSDEDLRRVKKILLGDLGTSEKRKLLMVDGFLEGMFSALGGIARKAMNELERREANMTHIIILSQLSNYNVCCRLLQSARAER